MRNLFLLITFSLLNLTVFSQVEETVTKEDSLLDLEFNKH